MRMVEARSLAIAAVLVLAATAGCMGSDTGNQEAAEPASDETPDRETVASNATEAPPLRTVERDFQMIAAFETPEVAGGSQGHYSGDEPYWTVVDVDANGTAPVTFTMWWNGTAAVSDAMSVLVQSDGETVADATGESPLELTVELDEGEYAFYPWLDRDGDAAFDHEVHPAIRHTIRGPVEQTFP